MKYSPDFPDRFGSLEDGRAFLTRYFASYNTMHRHSGIAMLAPSWSTTAARTPFSMLVMRSWNARTVRIRIVSSEASHAEARYRKACGSTDLSTTAQQPEYTLY
jgi:hypothetical protein